MGTEIKNSMNNTYIKFIPVLLILIGVLMRLLPHPANFAPITALAFFGAVYLPKRYGFILPIVAIFVSDLFLGFYGITMLFVYGSFLLSGLIGFAIRKHTSFLSVVGGSLLASISFFLITNFGVWVSQSSAYPKTFEGLMLCYMAGVPFFRNTLIGDLFFSGVFFGGYESLKYFMEKYFSITEKKI